MNNRQAITNRLFAALQKPTLFDYQTSRDIPARYGLGARNNLGSGFGCLQKQFARSVRFVQSFPYVLVEND